MASRAAMVAVGPLCSTSPRQPTAQLSMWVVVGRGVAETGLCLWQWPAPQRQRNPGTSGSPPPTSPPWEPGSAAHQQKSSMVAQEGQAERGPARTWSPHPRLQGDAARAADKLQGVSESPALSGAGPRHLWTLHPQGSGKASLPLQAQECLLLLPGLSRLPAPAPILEQG